MSDLKSGKEEFVPSDGWILAASEVEFTEGESVHCLLYTSTGWKACENE